MRNALNLRFCFLVTFLLFIPMMYALPPEGITIKGRVTDETLKEGVPGANVTVKGTSIGTITDFDGNFTIVAPSKKIRIKHLLYRVRNPGDRGRRQNNHQCFLKRRCTEPR